MQIKKITSGATAVAQNTTFFHNSAVPAEQIVQKIVVPVGGSVLTGGAVTELLPRIAQLEVPDVNLGAFTVTRVIARLSASVSVDMSAAAIASLILRRTDGSPANVATLFSGTDADPSVISAGWVQQNAALSVLAPTGALQTANLQVQIAGDGAETIAAQTLAGAAFLEIYILALPLQ